MDALAELEALVPKSGADDELEALVPRGTDAELEALIPKASTDRTRMSQLAVKVPEVISEWGLDFPKEIPGLSASEVETLNGLKREQVLKEATRRVNEPAARAIVRGTVQTIAGAAESMRDPVTLGAIALTPVLPEVPAVLFGYLGTKAVGQGAGELSVPGNLDTAGATRKILEMGLMTAGARGAGEALVRSYKPRGTGPPTTEGPLNAVSEFGGVAEIPPPSGQAGVENAAPGANGSDNFGASGGKMAEVVEKESPPSPLPSPPGEGAGTAILNKALNETLYARQPVPEKLARQYEEANGRSVVWPEGYKLEGDQYVYTEPERNLTPQQKFARENVEAMRRLTEAKRAAQETTEPQQETTPKQTVEPRERSAAELHREGIYRRIESEDDLADAMLRAMEARIAGQRQGMVDFRETGKGYWVDKGTGEGLVSQYGVSPEQAQQVLKEGQTPYQGELPGFDATSKTAGAGRAGGDTGAGRLSDAEAREALKTLQPEPLRQAFSKGAKVSSIKAGLAPQEIPQYRIHGTVINTPADFARTLMKIRSPYTETVKVVLLDKDNVVTHSQVLYSGTLDSAVFDSRDFLRLNAKYGKGSRRMLISHNHPSGDPTPSEADITATARLQRLAKAAGFEVVDHIITNGEKYYSFAGQAVEAIPAPVLAEWERMPRGELRRIETDADFQELAASLRQAEPTAAHIVYLSTRGHVTAVERLTVDADSGPAFIKAALKGVATEAPKALLIDFGPQMPADQAAGLSMQLNRALRQGGTTTRVADFSAQGMWSGRVQGYEYGVGEGPPDAGLVREGGEPGPERQRVQRILAGEASDTVKGEVAKDAIYRVRSFEQIQQEARGIVEQQGVDGALETFTRTDSGLPMDTRAALGAELEQRLRTAERVARASGNVIEAEALAQKQVDLWRADAYGTELAQGLNARKLYDGLSAAGKLQQARELFDEAGRNEMERQKPGIETVKQAIEQGRGDAVEAVKQDPATNEAARKAVDETVAGSAETHNAVVMELAQPWAESSVILNHARAAVHAKANELLNKGPQPPGLTPAARLRQILDDLAQRAAGIAAGHYQGAEPGITLAQKLEQRLGIGKEQAGRLAKQLDAEWSRQVEAAKKALPKRLAKARAANAAGLTLESTDTQVDAALRKQLQALNVKLGKLLVEEAGRKDATGKSVADRIVQASGLTGPAAEALRARLEARWAELLKTAARQRLEAMERGGAVVSRKMRGMFEDLVDLNRLGAMTDERFQDVVRKKLDLPELDDRLAREIVRRANDLEKLPAGDLRTRGAQELLNFVTRQRGIKWYEWPMSMYLANLLSGIKTPAKILFENGTLLAAHTLGAVRNPTLMRHPIELIAKPGLRGFGRGLMQSLEVLRSGTVTGVRSEGVRASGPLELKPFGPKLEWLNFWKWPLRAVAAAHVPLFKPAWELKQTAIAARVAKSEGLRGSALTQRVADLMGQTEERVAAARNQARDELQNAGYFQPRQAEESLIRYERRMARQKLDYTRRVGEIIIQGREQTMPGSTELARQHALHYTYLNEPYGMIGYVAKVVSSATNVARSAGGEQRLYAAAIKSQVPFATVASNLINEHLNWTPVGTARAIRSHFTNELYGRPLADADARADLYARSIAGTVLAYGLAHLVAQGIVKLTGPGPSAPNARKEWRDAGNEPWSVEVNGRRYSYQNTPWASSLAVLGAWNDWTKFDKGSEADANTRMAFALKAASSQMLSLPMLSGLRDFLEASTQSTSSGGKQLEKILARTASNLFFPKLLKDIDQTFDPKLYDQTGMGALLASQVPFVRRENKPVLNRLGDPVERGVWSSWTGKPDQDPVWRTIVEKNAFIPEPGRNQIVGDKKRGPDHYRAITADELYDIVAESGPRIRARLERALETGTTVGDTIYPPLTIAEPWQAQAVVRHIAEEEEHRAKARLRF